MLQEALRELEEPGDPLGKGAAVDTTAVDTAVDADLVDTAILLASELCENAVLHAGTEFEVALTVTEADLTVAVTDRGPGPLELHLAQPRQRYGRAASHGRGLALVQRLATTWGTRHESDGRHTIWFSLAREERPAAAPAPPAPPDAERVWTTAEQARWLLHVPPGLVDRLEPAELVAELVRRLRELLDAESVSVEVDEGDGTGAREIARDGSPDRGISTGGDIVSGVGTESGDRVEVRLPTTAPLRGVLRVMHRPGHRGTADPERTRDLTELIAYRVAMAVESQWLRAVDQRRRSWMTYLAETSELLGQSLDVDLAVAVVPQVVVPRLGRWCAIHLVEPSGAMRLAALTHADEDALPELRAVLDPDARPGLPTELRNRLAEVVRNGSSAIRFAVPTDGIALPLRARGRTLGTLLVGRPPNRPHSPEDVVLAGDVARRAALAIHNAQSTGAHVAVSQALQQALLPRALPVVPGVDFAAEYLPASSGSDVGGDFYDVLTIDPSSWLVSIGDVCGKGARAAARTGLVRDVLRVLVRDDRSLPHAIERLNEVMIEAGDPLQFCTLAAARVSRRHRGSGGGQGSSRGGLEVELVLAGHVQPVLVRADGTAELIGTFGTAVGLVPTVRLTCTQHRVGPGDTLLVYTDGVTERRRGREQFGAERLLRVAARAAGRPAVQVVGAVREAVERFSAEPLDDDVALLAVRAAP
ncbi:SpoIIE family protein phosphatase [Pseudonocardia cypriaca]|uniref:Serine phosphatase RsbU (Regulator of sigma subunit) n=1 Tax=Pseudonocardia cypriaca TaxID=882449 RepID=A0A543GH00_9PSEU|nr:SpoIIE family protein phosphatase [Pseudonocardia cypriaca]TQM45361.1 serine phosphatase RsbU (regulator of sigma subunit) [Pseudonocardia cypriaca]